MKKILSATLILALLAVPLMTLAEPAEGADWSQIVSPPAESAAGVNDLIVSAQVVAQSEEAVKAPASGELLPYSLRAGDLVPSGTELFTVSPKSVFADIDGTIAAVYAQPGDIADAAMSRYGSVLAIEHVDRYEIAGNVLTGYNSAENRTLYVGTHVYLRSVNEKHFAEGTIIEVDGRNFTVAVIGGDLVFTENVKVYRDPSYDNKTLLTRAGVVAIDPYKVSANGTIISMNVKAGDVVKAGDLLFTYVPDAIDPELRGKADATTVKADRDLIIAAVNVSQGSSVQKGQALCTVYPAGKYQLMAKVEESDVTDLNVGDAMTAVFEELGLPAASVTVASISPLGTEEDTSRYKVYFDFDAPEGVMIGMHATVQP